ncbi:type I methionyl aminopeptidase [Candidatus Aerophobetes bacterium]|uniref:Methionine aminopeptidase n=1 Tax=Aerophobetes bacterium TaxID=2030807 RepID=A0A523TJA0_UNCAE|nr:MAG: type I methionyl aminopeptidase [Candidatus Aerophobetes bacterium]
MVRLKSREQIEAIQKGGRIIAEIFENARDWVKPAISTLELDRWIADCIRKKGGRSAFKGYRGYPAETCISTNEEVVHGIPSSRRLEEGDIVGIDIGVKIQGYYADGAFTFPVGKISSKKKRLLEVTRAALYEGIGQIKPGNRIGDISSAIQRHVEKHGYSVVKTLFGHGTGEFLHEEPIIPNFGKERQGEKLREGMVLAIEPMVNQGGSEVRVLPNKWTVVTKDGSLSAHFEHTIAILDGKATILTSLLPEEREYLGG